MADIQLRDEMDSLREVLHELLVAEDQSVESILQASQELDKIIVKYLRQKKVAV